MHTPLEIACLSPLVQIVAAEDAAQADVREAEEIGSTLALSRTDVWLGYAGKRVLEMERHRARALKRIEAYDQQSLKQSELIRLALSIYAAAEAEREFVAEERRKEAEVKAAADKASAEKAAAERAAAERAAAERVAAERAAAEKAAVEKAAKENTSMVKEEGQQQATQGLLQPGPIATANQAIAQPVFHPAVERSEVKPSVPIPAAAQPVQAATEQPVQKKIEDVRSKLLASSLKYKLQKR